MLADALNSLIEQNVINAWKKLLPVVEELRENKQTKEQQQLQMFEEISNIAALLSGFEQCDKNNFHEWLESDIGDPGF